MQALKCGSAVWKVAILGACVLVYTCLCALLAAAPAYASQDSLAATGSDALSAQSSAQVQKSPMYRIYNPNSGEHFYTLNKAERNSLAQNGWHYEGVGWMAPSSGAEVFRLYNPNAGDHHYTTNAAERDHLASLGWIYEGVNSHAAAADATGAKALYRQYNPNAVAGAHNFTTSKDEANNVVGAGWSDEGTGWRVYEVPANYQDDMEPWRPRISGDYRFDTMLESITAVYTSLWDCYNYVTWAFSYREGNRFYGGDHYLDNGTTMAYAQEMQDVGSGNCYRFASLFCWLARALGYDANVVSGWVPSYSGGQAPHGWVEIYLDGETYICDPDLEHELGGDWYMNTYGSAHTTYGSW